MRRALIHLAGLIALVAFAGFALASGDRPAIRSAQPGRGRLTLSATVLHEDEATIVEALYNRGVSTKPIGNAVLSCSALPSLRGPLPPGSRLCRGVYRLPRGTLDVAGLVSDRGIYQLAVIGGTGYYANTGAGELDAVTVAPGPPRRELLAFRIYST